MSKTLRGFRKRELFLSTLTGFLFALFILLPFFLVWINLIILYMRHAEWFLALITLTLAVFGYLSVRFTHKTLAMYRPHTLTKRERLIEGVSVAALLAGAGLAGSLYFLAQF